jgi:hypothetical protein
VELTELINPQGVTIRVAPEKAERLVKIGYRRADEPAPTPKRRGRPKKTEN